MTFLNEIHSFFKRDTERFKLSAKKKYGKEGTFQKDVKKFFGEPKDIVEAGIEFAQSGAEQLPFYNKLEKEAWNFGRKLEKDYPQFREFRRKLIDSGFKEIQEIPKPNVPDTTFEKAMSGSGAVTSNIAQFWLMGKVSTAVLGQVGRNLKLVDIGRKLGIPLRDLKAAEKILGISLKADPAPWINRAAQWGLYSLPRLQSPTTQGKIQELAADMVTGGAFGAISQVPGMNAIVRYLADVTAPYIIRSTIGGDPEKAKEEALYYSLAGLPFLAGTIGKGGKPPAPGEPPSALLAPGAAPPAGPPPAAIIPTQLEKPTQALMDYGKAITVSDVNKIRNRAWREASQIDEKGVLRRDPIKSQMLEEQYLDEAYKDRSLKTNNFYESLQPKYKIGDIVEFKGRKVRITGAEFDTVKDATTMLRTGFPASFKFSGLVANVNTSVTEKVQSGKGEIRIYPSDKIGTNILSDTLKIKPEDVLTKVRQLSQVPEPTLRPVEPALPSIPHLPTQPKGVGGVKIGEPKVYTGSITREKATYWKIESQVSKAEAAIDEKGTGWITNLETKEEFRRQGKAEEIIDTAKAFLMRKGVSEIRVVPESEASRNLFKKLGFVDEGGEMTIHLPTQPKGVGGVKTLYRGVKKGFPNTGSLESWVTSDYVTAQKYAGEGGKVLEVPATTELLSKLKYPGERLENGVKQFQGSLSYNDAKKLGIDDFKTAQPPTQPKGVGGVAQQPSVKGGLYNQTLYHGTDVESAKNIREKGFSLSEKYKRPREWSDFTGDIKGVSFSPNIERARQFTFGPGMESGAAIVKARIDSSANIVRFDTFNKLADKVGVKKALEQLKPDALLDDEEGSEELVVLNLNKVSIEEKKPKLTLKQLEKETTTEKFTQFLKDSTSPSNYAKRLDTLTKQLDKPQTKSKLRLMRKLAMDQIASITGSDTVHWKQRFFVIEAAKGDPLNAEPIRALEDFIDKIDTITGGRAVKAKFETAEILNLPKDGKYYVPYGKASFRGTLNREWVRQTVPLVYMGNKSQMIDYIVRGVFNVNQRDLGNITPEDVKHLNKYKNVYDVFGGSGLLTDLSKLLFKKASFHYNELDPEVFNALKVVQKTPSPIKKHVLQVAKYLKDNPGADWLAHFKLVFKEDSNFRVAAKLIESTVGRTGEITNTKLSNLVKAIPNFSKIFKDVEMKNENAIKVLNRLAKTGTKSDVVFIDPPYLWSTGYAVGTEFEKAAGFNDLLDLVERLGRRVSLVFFNNDPEIQVAKAGTESVHLQNIMGRLNELTKDMVVVHGVKPIGTQREEIIITNTPEAKKSLNLLVQDEVEQKIRDLKGVPAGELSSEMLKFWREIAGSTRFVPEAQKITARQIKRIRTFRSRLRMRNRELIPVLDEILQERSFAKMTKEDGARIIEWLQPKNWDVIESKIHQLRDLAAKERRAAAIGDRFTSSQKELEDKVGAVAGINGVLSGMEDLKRILDNLMPVTDKKPHIVRKLLSVLARFPLEFPQEAVADVLQIDLTFHAPMLAVIKLGNRLTAEMKGFKKIFKDLTPKEREMVIDMRAGIKVKGKVPDKVQVASDYFKELTGMVAEVNNRLAEAAGDKPMEIIEDYWPYILDASIIDAAALGEIHKPQEHRISTINDFKRGVFDKDPERVIDLWANASGKWLTKRLFKAFLQDRYEALFENDWFQGNYARSIVNYNIYGMRPEIDKLLRSAGAEVNRAIGSIKPKRIKISDDWRDFILNSHSLRPLHEDAKQGYMKVPRGWLKIPNINRAFHVLFYPNKLFGNFLFVLKNLTQQFQAMPFTGLRDYIGGFDKWVRTAMPVNRDERKRMMDSLKEAGYEFGRVADTIEIPQFKDKVGVFVQRLFNSFNDVPEFLMRTLGQQTGSGFTERIGNKVSKNIPAEQKARVGAEFSAWIHYVPGRGHSPVMSRTVAGRIGYTFLQYPLYTIHKLWQMLDYARSDKRARELWEAVAIKGYSPDAYEAFKEMPAPSKVRFYLIALAFALTAGMVYYVTGSWKAAQDSLPGKPRIVPMDVFAAFFKYYDNPSADTKAELENQIKLLWSSVFIQRLSKSKEIKKYGFVTTRNGRPVPIANHEEKAKQTFLWGLSVLPEYEDAYPSLLGKYLGGKTQASDVEKLQTERGEETAKDTENAVRFMKLSREGDVQAMNKFFDELIAKGEATDGLKDKINQFEGEQARGQGILERRITGLQDKKQAEFVLDELKKAGSPQEESKLIEEFVVKGILTDNVKAMIKEVIKERALEKKGNGLFEGLFK